MPRPELRDGGREEPMAGLKADELALAALEEGAADQGLDIVDVELSGPGSHPTLRVRVDLLEGGPIDMDRVTACTSWVSEVVETLDPIDGPYELEVSSPGVDRPLRRPCDFARFAGELVEVSACEPIEGRKAWTGTIGEVDDEGFVLHAEGIDVRMPFCVVKRAKIKPDYDKIMAEAKKAAKAKGDEGSEEAGE